MRVLLQRVTRAAVTVDGGVVGKIGPGVVLLVGVGSEDCRADADKLAKKIANMRIFSDEAGKFTYSVLDVGGSALVISQFTLFADSRKGRRPAFTAAARPEHAEPMVAYFAQRLVEQGITRVETGRFGASMMVELVNHGPVTIWLDSAE